MLGLLEGLAAIADLNGPVTEEEVVRAESQLGVRFPKSYRVFLQRYGCGSVDGYEFLGIVSGSVGEGWPGVVWVTKREREWGLPSDFIVVYRSGIGDTYCLDVGRTGPDGEAPVILWLPGAPLDEQCLDPVFESFADLVFDLLDPPPLDLRTVVQTLRSLDEARSIYISPARPWNGSSLVELAYADEGEEPPRRATGLSYFLKVGHAKEAIEALRASRGGREPSEEDRLAAVLHRAEQRRFLPSESPGGGEAASLGDPRPPRP
jgi:hypothetical protein